VRKKRKKLPKYASEDPARNTKEHPIMKRVSFTSNEYTAEDWNQNMFEASRSKIW
jgi:hypothetical protein